MITSTSFRNLIIRQIFAIQKQVGIFPYVHIPRVGNISRFYNYTRIFNKYILDQLTLTGHHYEIN